MKLFASLSAGTRILAIMVAGVGAASFFYGGYRLYERVFTPFQFSIPVQQLAQLVPQSEEERIFELKSADTDNDGLSDYDEIYIYGTSPYLADTDSDGISDAVEVTTGDDPNCPVGETCQAIRLVTPTTKISDLFPQFSDSEVTLKDKTLEEFRAILIEQGYDPELLTEVSDETLLLVLEETLKFQDQELGGEVTAGEEEVDLDSIRLLLIELGASEDEVYSLSNQELEEILATFQ